jgi:hypothetical protein
MVNNSQKLDIEIRTMKSDVESMKAGGGDATNAQFVKLTEDKIPESVSEEIKINIKAPGYIGSEQGIFSSSGEIKSKASAQQAGFKKFPIKTFIIVAFSVSVIAGLGYVAYNIALRILR